MHQLSVETTTTYLPHGEEIAAFSLGREVHRTLPLVPDSAFSLSTEPSVVYGDSRDLFATENILASKADYLTERIPKSEQINFTGAVPEAIIGNWQLLARSGLTVKTYCYILKLARKDAGWRGQGSRPMNGQSLASFLRFWDLIAETAREPEFVLMPNGNLQIEWYKDDYHFVELEFQPDKSIMFGIFDGKTVIEGVARANEIVSFLKQMDLKPVKWSYAGQT